VNIVKIKLSDLKRPEKNLRLHPEKQIAEMERSVAMFGQIRPIIVDEYNIMLAGNGLYDAMLRMGMTEADCFVVEGLTEPQKKKLMLADNRIFDLGVDDLAAFENFLLDLGGDLDIPGFDEDMLKSLVMAADEAVGLVTGYGTVSPEKVQEIHDAGERYKAREDAAVREAQEHTPTNAPPAAEPESRQEDGMAGVREAAEYEEPYKAEKQELRYILCPKCGERIWL